MDEPVILTGGPTMIAITLPSSFKVEDIKRGKFSVTPKSATSLTIVVTNTATGEENSFSFDHWKIEVK